MPGLKAVRGNRAASDACPDGRKGSRGNPCCGQDTGRRILGDGGCGRDNGGIPYGIMTDRKDGNGGSAYAD